MHCKPTAPYIGTITDSDGLRRRADTSRAPRLAPLYGVLDLAPAAMDTTGQLHRPVALSGATELSGVALGPAVDQMVWALVLCNESGDPAMTLTGVCEPGSLQRSLRSAISNFLGGLELTHPNSVLLHVLPGGHHRSRTRSLHDLRQGRPICVATQEIPVHIAEAGPVAEQAVLGYLAQSDCPNPGSPRCSSDAQDAVVAYTDGSWVQGSSGGAAMITTDGHWAATKVPTCARDSLDCEIEAARLAIEAAPPEADLTIRSDCQHLVTALNTFTATRIRRTRRRLTLERLFDAVERHRGQVRAEWVKGHSGTQLNDAADRMARVVARRRRLGLSQDTILSIISSIVAETSQRASLCSLSGRHTLNQYSEFRIPESGIVWCHEWQRHDRARLVQDTVRQSAHAPRRELDRARWR